jgi:hypothetical protein
LPTRCASPPAGDYDQSLAKLNLSQRQVPMVVKLRDDARRTSSCSRACRCRARTARCRWATWPARARQRPGEIDRYDRVRNVNFEVELNQQPLGESRSSPGAAQPEATCRRV